jgi:hypothetical protein
MILRNEGVAKFKFNLYQCFLTFRVLLTGGIGNQKILPACSNTVLSWCVSLCVGQLVKVKN